MSNAVRSACRLVAMVFVARTGGVEAVGWLAMTVAIEAIVISTLGAFFASPAAVLAPGRRRTLRLVVHRHAEQLQSRSGLVLALACALAGISAGVEFTLVLSYCSYMAVAPLYQSRRSTHLSEFSSRRVLAAECMIGLFGVTGPAIAPRLSLDPLTSYWAAQAIGHGVSFLWVPAACPNIRARASASIAARRSILATGRAMVLGSLANSCSVRLHPILISIMLGSASAGLFGAASTFGAPIRMLGGTLRGVLLPRFARRQRVLSRTDLGLLTLAGVLLAMAACCGLVKVLAPIGVQTFFGPEFVDAAALVPLCVLLALMGTATSVVVCLRQASGESHMVARVRVVCSGLAVFLFMIGILTGGLAAGILGCTIAEFLCLLVLWTSSADRTARPSSLHARVIRSWRPSCAIAASFRH